MKIAILDSYACDFDGLTWSAFEKLGEVRIYPRTDPLDLMNRAADCETLIVNKVVIDKEVINSLPLLEYIGVTATGVNNVDLKAAAERRVTVTNVPAYGTDAVAQMVFAYLLHHYSKVAAYNALTHSGEWAKSKDFCLHGPPLQELAGSTVTIVGYGAIGRKVSQLARAFGMTVLLAEVPGRRYSTVGGEQRLPLKDAFGEADVITLHCALSESTFQLINSKTISFMKPGAVLINTARGGLVNEADLFEAVKEGEIAAAFLDVLCSEPPPADHPLLELPQVTVTPHVAWATREGRERLIAESAENLKAYIEGSRRNIVV
ncbi:MAG: D-2-hydroxyacid dehydrogenase [Deltaproteobacteria bacterium]|nr:D-2-hydroxyacid dehydrogenase [Deltaproteobacteria bacterium]